MYLLNRKCYAIKAHLSSVTIKIWLMFQECKLQLLLVTKEQGNIGSFKKCILLVVVSVNVAQIQHQLKHGIFIQKEMGMGEGLDNMSTLSILSCSFNANDR